MVITKISSFLSKKFMKKNEKNKMESIHFHLYVWLKGIKIYIASFSVLLISSHFIWGNGCKGIFFIMIENILPFLTFFANQTSKNLRENVFFSHFFSFYHNSNRSLWKSLSGHRYFRFASIRWCVLISGFLWWFPVEFMWDSVWCICCIVIIVPCFLVN